VNDASFTGIGISMKGIKAIHAQIAMSGLWKSPPLHILLTFEDELYIARCLDFLISSHGKTEEQAFKSLAQAIKEYILTAAENNAWNTLLDPAHSKYWHLFNRLDSMREDAPKFFDFETKKSYPLSRMVKRL
jgi:hypothetical protein